MAAMASAATTAAWVDGNTVVFTGLPRRDDLIDQFVGRSTPNSERQHLGNQPCDGAAHKKGP